MYGCRCIGSQAETAGMPQHVWMRLKASSAASPATILATPPQPARDQEPASPFVFTSERGAPFTTAALGAQG